jgi:hypothetical protein
MLDTGCWILAMEWERYTGEYSQVSRMDVGKMTLNIEHRIMNNEEDAIFSIPDT